MILVLFEVTIKKQYRDDYLALAANSFFGHPN